MLYFLCACVVFSALLVLNCWWSGGGVSISIVSHTHHPMAGVLGSWHTLCSCMLKWHAIAQPANYHCFREKESRGQCGLCWCLETVNSLQNSLEIQICLLCSCFSVQHSSSEVESAQAQLLWLPEASRLPTLFRLGSPSTQYPVLPDQARFRSNVKLLCTILTVLLALIIEFWKL